MNLQLTRSRLSLARRQTLRLADAAGVRIDARAGTLWVTQDNDRRDVVLRAGESFTLDGEGDAIVQAFEPSCVALTPPAATGRGFVAETWPQRVGAWLGRAFARPAWA